MKTGAISGRLPPHHHHVVPRSLLVLIATVLLWGVVVTCAGAAERRSSAAPTYTALDGVSCVSATVCVAVGGAAKGGDGPDTVAFRPLAEVWNRSTWRIVPTPEPRGFTGSELRAVSCVAANACVAVGITLRRTAAHGTVTTAFAERWNGTKWTLQSLPKLPRSTSLYGVSCATAASCTAVGYYNFGQAALIERWNGRAWKVLPSPHPRTLVYRLMFLSGVSCSSPVACVAVGESETGLPYSPAYNTYRSLAERWDGRRWTIESTPRPPGASEAFLQGVSCLRGGACFAAGWGTRSKDVSQYLLAESWTGRSWAIQPAAQANARSTLDFGAISCSAAAQCMAVGDHAAPQQPGAEFGVVAEQKSSAGWRFTSVPTPAGERLGGLSAVSCIAPDECTAVGNVDDGVGSTVEQLIERWDGARWSIQRNPTP